MDILSLKDAEDIYFLYSSHNPFICNPKIIIADPFLFVHNDLLYLFYEEQINRISMGGKGEIRVTCTSDLKNWSTPKTVLKENFHLSYPFVFEDKGKIYMIPESADDESIRLYSSDDSLTKWKLERKLFEGEQFVDSCVFKKENTYFLMTTMLKNGENHLKLYISEALEEPWKEHPQRPIVDESFNRCGGSIFEYKDNLYRPSQRHDNYYGSGLDLYQIDELSITEYKEHKVFDNFLPKNKFLYKIGGHHFNYVNFKGNYIIATDYLIRNCDFVDLLKRIIFKEKHMDLNRVK